VTVPQPVGLASGLGDEEDGSTCFCVDYCGLNCITKQDSYPLPQVDNILDILTGLVWQIPVCKEVYCQCCW
jgi:hypothetical protein